MNRDFHVSMNWDDIGMDIVRWCIASFVQACPQYANLGDLKDIESKDVTTAFRVKDCDGTKTVQCSTILDSTNTVLIVRYDVPVLADKPDFGEEKVANEINAHCRMIHGGDEDVFSVRFDTKVETLRGLSPIVKVNS